MIKWYLFFGFSAVLLVGATIFSVMMRTESSAVVTAMGATISLLAFIGNGIEHILKTIDAKK